MYCVYCADACVCLYINIHTHTTKRDREYVWTDKACSIVSYLLIINVTIDCILQPTPSFFSAIWWMLTGSYLRTYGHSVQPACPAETASWPAAMKTVYSCQTQQWKQYTRTKHSNAKQYTHIPTAAMKTVCLYQLQQWKQHTHTNHSNENSILITAAMKNGRWNYSIQQNCECVFPNIKVSHSSKSVIFPKACELKCIQFCEQWHS